MYPRSVELPVLRDSTVCGFIFWQVCGMILMKGGQQTMDQIKTGKFIAQMRKEKGFTQSQLADKLFISNKTISKWETGKGLPEVSLMLPLCEVLGINVNELLTGEKIPIAEYKEKAEENMTNLVQEAQESRKKIILSEVVGLLSALSAVPLVVVSEMFEMHIAARIALVAIAVTVLVIGIAVAYILNREAGAFECSKCHTRFVPTMSEYVKSSHIITRRKLKCPNCGCKSYCKHVLTRSK